MAKRLIVVLALLLGCDTTILSSSRCEIPCYDGPPETFNVGECSSGTPICVEGSLIECGGQKLPAVEMCNGLDDDCDGKSDEAVHDETIGDPCGTNVGECETGSLQCYKGKLTCYAEAPPKPETCNGKDDDCNGVVDDVLFTNYCFSGQPETLAYPPCHAGILMCKDGSLQCLHEVTASQEICDGIDNNCNGRVDEGLSKKYYDVVLAIDRSCSMLNGSFTAGVQAMAKATTEHIGVPEVRFAIIVFPESDTNTVPLLIADFTDAESALHIISSLKGLPNTGFEPSYDVIHAVTQNTLELNYLKGSIRFLFMWTDEAGQTFQLPPVYEEELAELITNTSLVFVAFVPQMYAASFDDIAVESGGSVHALTDATSMAQTIITYLDTGCEE